MKINTERNRLMCGLGVPAELMEAEGVTLGRACKRAIIFNKVKFGCSHRLTAKKAP